MTMCHVLTPPPQVRPLSVPEWGALLDHYYTMAL